MHVSRRQFMQSSAAITLGFGGLSLLMRRAAAEGPVARLATEGFGPLLPEPGGERRRQRPSPPHTDVPGGLEGDEVQGGR